MHHDGKKQTRFVSILSNCSLKHSLHHCKVIDESNWRDVSNACTYQKMLQQSKSHFALSCILFLMKKIIGQVGLSFMICRAQRTDQVLQNAVEGTHRDLVQVVLTMNHWTTLLTGSAAYSLQDTLHQYTSHCSNHGRPPEINKILTSLIMSHVSLCDHVGGQI